MFGRRGKEIDEPTPNTIGEFEKGWTESLLLSFVGNSKRFDSRFVDLTSEVHGVRVEMITPSVDIVYSVALQ